VKIHLKCELFWEICHERRVKKNTPCANKRGGGSSGEVWEGEGARVKKKKKCFPSKEGAGWGMVRIKGEKRGREPWKRGESEERNLHLYGVWVAEGWEKNRRRKCFGFGEHGRRRGGKKKGKGWCSLSGLIRGTKRVYYQLNKKKRGWGCVWLILRGGR